MKSDPTPLSQTANVVVRNVGGIDETTVTLTNGVTVLEGQNATNRTSLLQAIMAGLGSENVSVKADADEGHVELTIGDEVSTRTLSRQGDGVRASGDSYLDDPEVADLFAFLLESNPARQAVRRQDDLREIIMRPVDTDELQQKIDDLQREKREIDDRLETLADLTERRDRLERRRAELSERVEETRAELEEKRAELADRERENDGDERSEREEKLAELRDLRSELEDVRFRLESERDSLASLEEQRADLRAERADLPAVSVEEISDLGERIGELQERKRRLGSALDRLQNVIQFNEQTLADDTSEIRDLLSADDDGDHLTSQLVDDEDFVCWTCGSEVSEADVEETLQSLRTLREEKFGERKEIESELAELNEERDRIEDKQQRREQLEHKLERTADEIERRQSNVESLRSTAAELEDRIDPLEDEIEELEREAQSETLDVHKEINQLEVELETLENDRDEIEDELAAVEDELAERDDLERRRETVREELTEVRNRIDALESEAVEEFNDHMETVLDILAYENVDRIWLERTERTVDEGRRSVDRRFFDLHVVRTTDSGAAFEDTVANLSESEREVTSLVFALAGYLTHDVFETVPFMLLDSLEAIDADRIATLVEYLADYSDFLVVALLSEDAAALDDDYQRVTEI